MHNHPCVRCRAHKKKCDRLTTCSNCAKRNVPCEYTVGEKRRPYHDNITVKFKKLASTVNILIDKIEVEAQVPRSKRFNPSDSWLGRLQDLESYQIPLLYFQLSRMNNLSIIHNNVSNSSTENLLNMFFCFLHPISTFIDKQKVYEILKSRESGTNPLLVTILLRAQYFFMSYFNPDQPPIKEEMYLYRLACHLINIDSHNHSLEMIQACLLLCEFEASFCSPRADYYLNMAVKMSHVENLHCIENYMNFESSHHDKVHCYMTYLMLVLMEERLFFQVKLTGLASISSRYNLLHISNCKQLNRPIDLMISSQLTAHFIFYLADIQSRVNVNISNGNQSSKLKTFDLEEIHKILIFVHHYPTHQACQDLNDASKNKFSPHSNSRIILYITLALLTQFLVDVKKLFESRSFEIEHNTTNDQWLEKIHHEFAKIPDLSHNICISMMKFANANTDHEDHRYGLHPLEVSDYRVSYAYFYSLKHFLDLGFSQEDPQLIKLIDKLKLTCRLWTISAPLSNLISQISNVQHSITLHDFNN